jgi:glycerophosphoryl diester phosphodiesterase
MRKGLRALSVVIAVGIALVFGEPAAHAGPLDQIAVAHRGASTPTIAEGTMASYRYAVRNGADWLDGDIRWTKDGPDADTVGTMVILHDSTLNRITNCSGYVTSWLWSSIYDRCRTDKGKQRLIRLVDLLNYGSSAGVPFSLEIKTSRITDAQARQLWNNIKRYRVRLLAMPGALPSLNKIKKRDAADPNYRLTYSTVITGTSGWPSASWVKANGTQVDVHLSVPASVVRSYKAAGIPVFVFTGKTEADYARMTRLNPTGVVVDDIARFQRWRDAQA